MTYQMFLYALRVSSSTGLLANHATGLSSTRYVRRVFGWVARIGGYFALKKHPPNCARSEDELIAWVETYLST